MSPTSLSVLDMIGTPAHPDPDSVQTANTIEGRILRIQKRKTAIIKEAFRGKGSDGADPESIQNLNIMFGDDEEDDWITG
jgi:hypothetical protein